MQSVSSRIWTRVAVSISSDDNDYTTGTSRPPCLIRNLHTMVWLTCWNHFQLWPGSQQEIREFFSQKDPIEVFDLPYLRKKLVTVVEGDPKVPFKYLRHRGVGKALPLSLDLFTLLLIHTLFAINSWRNLKTPCCITWYLPRKPKY